MTPQNGHSPEQPNIQLQPFQLAALLVLDGCAMALQTGINQLGGFLGLKREAEILGNALSHIQRDKQRLLEEWQKRVVVAPAAALAVIEGAKK